LSRRNP